MSKIMRLAVIAGGLLGAIAAPMAAAAQQVNWKMHHIWVPGRSEAKLFDRFAERIAEKSGGRFVVKVFGGGTLGLKDVDILRTLPTGTVEMAAIYPGYLSRDAPDIASLYVQGAIINPEEHFRAVDEMREIYTRLYAKYDIPVIGFLQPPLYLESVVCRDTPVQTMEQLKGKKLRVWSRDMVQSFNKLGVAAQIVPQNDLYLAMQTGVIDCAIYSPSSLKTISLQEVAKFSSYLYPLAGAPYAIIVNKKAWTALPPDLQKVATEAADWVFAESKKEAIDTISPAVVAELSTVGHKVLPPF
ncbi:MAG: TRAP transporter substrate-binding protein DctP, partial [Alphaproteobacteria bacterium]|nr:TRAP transporter substrate-binding protein DctP [Alphaproteobacteria bacterium]